MMKWAKSCDKNNVEFVISIDDDDPDNVHYSGQYRRKFQAKTGVKTTLISNANRSAIDAINNGAKSAKGDIFIVVSDDTDPIEGWDDKIVKATLGKNDWILKTQDGIQPWIITMPVMDRTYYDRFGYIYYPEYQHLFADTEITCVADITGRKIVSNLKFVHKHYSITGEGPDNLNRRADATWKQGEDLFIERYKRNFDLPPGQPIQDKGMIRFIQNKL
jgi:hypothetical protein